MQDSILVELKKIVLLTFVFLLLSTAVTVGFVRPVVAHALEVGETKQEVLFEDDFESYAVGTFPYAGGWNLWTDGAGTQYQVVVDSVSVSPSKSLQLRGDRGWLATASKLYTAGSIKTGFEVCVRVKESGGARVGFTKRISSSVIRFYSAVEFYYGKIVLGRLELEPYVAGEWYKVKQVIDRSKDTCSVWINDVLRASDVDLTTNDVPGEYHYNEIEAFTLASSHYNEIDAYFDDVKVFVTFELAPRLELMPTAGIASTTLVGSGFAPNSRITITWDGTAIPTVPSPLVTNGYGNFTAIISVLNQTAIGPHTVKAVDEIGTEANATFTVIPEFPMWTPMLIVLIVLTVAVAIYKRRLLKTPIH